MSPARNIILIPKDQITSRLIVLKWISKYQEKLTTINSIKTNQIPLFSRNTDNSDFDFFLPTRNADMPAKKLNAGAQ